MTLEESLQTAFNYADSEESDFDYEDMFYTLADEAQKQLVIITNTDILRVIKVEPDFDNNKVVVTDDGTVTEIPCNDFTAPILINLPYYFKKIVEATADYTLGQNGLSVVPSAELEITYASYPKTITNETSREYVYEIPEYMHAAIPYYIAYRLVNTDDSSLYTALKNEWRNQVNMISQYGAKGKYVEVKNVYGV